MHPLTGWFPKGLLKHKFERIEVTKFFGSNDFGHIGPMKVSLFWKCSKFYIDFENAIKLPEDVDGFEDNGAWTCCGSFCQLRQEYTWSTVNGLRKCPKTSDPTKRHDTQLNLFDINEKLTEKCCSADFSSVFDPLTGWFPNGVLKQ